MKFAQGITIAGPLAGEDLERIDALMEEQLPP
jgi:hypothetical protein